MRLVAVVVDAVAAGLGVAVAVRKSLIFLGLPDSKLADERLEDIHSTHKSTEFGCARRAGIFFFVHFLFC